MNTSVTNSAYPDALTMQEARDRFLASNGFLVEDYSAPTYTVKLAIACKIPQYEGSPVGYAAP